jgi:hypothetical protein
MERCPRGYLFVDFLDFSAGSTADRENKAVFCEKESVAA